MARLLPLLALVCAFYVLYQIWIVEKNKRSNEEKLLWTLLALLFNIITAVIFYVFERKNTHNDDTDIFKTN